MGYDTVMHEKAEVAYTQNTPPENDCYREIMGCEIVVCIIGAQFGSRSVNNELSITMNEIDRAIKERKRRKPFEIKRNLRKSRFEGGQ